MELRPITADDLPLYVAVHCDPVMMAHLGGPRPEEEMPGKLRDDLRSVDEGSAWIYVIQLDDGPAGTVVGWRHEWNGEPITEVGWTVLPRFQGRGLATRAVSAMLDDARLEGRWDVVHAFPPTSNAASNALCRRLGFSLRGEVDVDYRGRVLRCHHWALDLRAS